MGNGQAQTGLLSSKPKTTDIKADDSLSLVYRNLGNNHNQPFIWADTVTHSGTETVVASGVVLHGMDLATYGKVVATPQETVGAYFWVEKNATTNVVSIKSSASMSNVDFNVIFMLGSDVDVSSIFCRG